MFWCLIFNFELCKLIAPLPFQLFSPFLYIKLPPVGDVCTHAKGEKSEHEPKNEPQRRKINFAPPSFLA